MLSRILRLLGGGGNAAAAIDTKRFISSCEGVPLVELRGLTKKFLGDGVETRALSNVRLIIRHGEFVTVAGPSGCGKSTLLHIIGLLESPTSGSYLLNGVPVADLKQAELAWIRNKVVGFIFQNFNLIGDLSVLENVEVPLSYIGVPAAPRRERAMEALQQVNMEKFIKRYPGQLTGGEQQRVAVARAVVNEPMIIMADEPTGNLDSKNGEAVMELLQQLHANGSTLFLVTHNPEYALRSERSVDLFDGRIVDLAAE